MCGIRKTRTRISKPCSRHSLFFLLLWLGAFPCFWILEDVIGFCFVWAPAA